MDVSITRLEPAQFRDRLPDLLRVYVDAMGYDPRVMRTRAPAWLEHSRRAGFSALVALRRQRRLLPGFRDSEVVGLVYGYTSAPGQWWFDQVSRGLERSGAPVPDDFVELTELHVAPEHQGNGVGADLLEQFLSTRTEEAVMLSTPEVTGEENAAWRLYRALGFTDVLRDFHFEGDPRPFGVLSATLPLHVESGAEGSRTIGG